VEVRPFAMAARGKTIMVDYGNISDKRASQMAALENSKLLLVREVYIYIALR
jgi:hypothetical protein